MEHGAILESKHASHHRAGGDIMAAMRGAFDFDCDVCPRCRHTLTDERCPSCAWTTPAIDASRETLYDPHDDVPSIRGW